MKYIIIPLFIILFSFPGFAKKTVVSQASEITGKFWFPGDTIVMQNGTWTNQSIGIRADGTESEPIVLMAETPGQVILTGTSKVEFSGEYIHVTGLYFKDGTLSGSAVISYRTSSSSLADNCRVSNCAIVNYNPSSKTSDSKWVSIYGENNKLDHCYFENKTNSGTLLVVWMKSGLTPNHVIDSNYFGYRNSNKDSSGKELNGQEIIRIGDSSTSMLNGKVKVTNNFFERCNGEIEIISNKSCENVYKNNVFYECVGMLTLRHGNRCTVDGNYFFGNGLSNTGGVRIIGEDHKVYNNYFEKLRGTGYRAALCIVRGQEDSKLNEYFQVKNADIAFNTFVDCKLSFNINYNSSSSRKMPPIGTTISNNHIYNTSSSNTNVTMGQVNADLMDVSWSNNLMNKGDYNAFPYTASEVITDVDPEMILSGTRISILEPTATSGLGNYASNAILDVKSDIRGRNRGSDKIPGSSQLSGETSIVMPDWDAVGVSYINAGATGVKIQKTDTYFQAFFNQNQLITNTKKSGLIQIHDLSGKCLLKKNIEGGYNEISVLQQGIMLVSFKPKNGVFITKKVVNRWN